MILVGNQRGGARDLAKHLMKQENERVVVHDVRGFIASDLDGAFQESQAISKATRCRQHLYSLSLNPPKDVHATPEMFEAAIEQAEDRLGLSGQPRAVVFHEKRGTDGEIRRHAHAVWCRIDLQNMRAVQMSHDRSKLNGLARDLYREHGWTMPRGFVRHEERNPRNYTLAEWQQAKRAGRDPAQLKGMIQDCWMISDSKTSFANALKENGFILARGDKRGAVAVDHTGEAFPVGRAVGIKAKQVRERLGNLEELPNRKDAHNAASKLVTDRLQELQQEQRRAARQRLERIATERRAAIKSQKRETERQEELNSKRIASEIQDAQDRIRKGWRGLLDRVTGKRKRIDAENALRLSTVQSEQEMAKATLEQAQAAVRKKMLAAATDLKSRYKSNIRELGDDIHRLEPTKHPDRSEEQKREAFKAKRRRTPTAERKKRRSNNPGYSRDGPSPGR